MRIGSGFRWSERLRFFDRLGMFSSIACGPDFPVEKMSGRLGHGLKEIGIEYQLQLSRRFRRGLAILGITELSVGSEAEIMLSRHVMRRLRIQLPPNRCVLPANEPP